MGKTTENLARVTRIGLDLAKSVFQVHCVGAQGEVVIARKLRRGSMLEFFGQLAPCVVAMEACGSAHHWGRQLVALGHEVKLIPPAHVKPYVRRNKTDAADAAAICEAAMRPGQRFVALRSIDNQVAVMLHRVREQLAMVHVDEALLPQHVASGDTAFDTDPIPGNTLPSSFCKVMSNTDSIVFYEGHGFGHGVGMSQWSAEDQAEHGMGYEEILTTAYPQTKFASAY